jgi:hypothetical protein
MPPGVIANFQASLLLLKSVCNGKFERMMNSRGHYHYFNKMKHAYARNRLKNKAFPGCAYRPDFSASRTKHSRRPGRKPARKDELFRRSSKEIRAYENKVRNPHFGN